jgi:hypothetical protein
VKLASLELLLPNVLRTLSRIAVASSARAAGTQATPTEDVGSKASRFRLKTLPRDITLPPARVSSATALTKMMDGSA